MFVSIKIRNYLSFREPVIFSLEAEPIKEHFLENTFDTEISNLRLTKGCSIYGVNASGKSNLLKALNFVTKFISESARGASINEEINVIPFKLSSVTENEPSEFEIKIIVEGILYRYGFVVDRQSVKGEWLYCTKRIKEYLLFIRSNNVYEITDKFPEGEDELIQEKTRKNALFLSTVAYLNGEKSTSVVEGINKLIFLGDVPLTSDRTVELFKSPAYTNSIFNFLNSADLGISEFSSVQINYSDHYATKTQASPKERVSIKHKKVDENNNTIGEVLLDLQQEESQGTNKFFNLSGYVVDALLNGKTLIIDEFTSRLHPLLAKHIIDMFHNREINRTNAQFIFTTQNTFLMNIEWYRRDQIVVIYKNQQNASEITNFFKQNIRNDAAFEKKYLSKTSIGTPKLLLPKIGNNQLNLFEDK